MNVLVPVSNTPPRFGTVSEPGPLIGPLSVKKILLPLMVVGAASVSGLLMVTCSKPDEFPIVALAPAKVIVCPLKL